MTSSPRRSGSPLVEPTGLFSLTKNGNKLSVSGVRLVGQLTNTHNCGLQLGRGHPLQYTLPQVPKIEQTSKLNRTLLQLQLKCCSIFGQYLSDTVLFVRGCGITRRNFGYRCEHKLTCQVIGIRGVERRNKEVDSFLV